MADTNCGMEISMEKREVYQFTKDCLIGVESIDSEHEGLFALINKVLEVIETSSEDWQSVVVQLLEELRSYANIHFEHEEKYMAQINDPEFSRQKREHQSFVDKINSVDVSVLNDDEGKAALEDLMKYLTKWLYRHIIGSDSLIGKLQSLDVKRTRVIEFTDEYKTGIELVDTEHKNLFDIIQRAMDAVYAQNLADKYDVTMSVIYELKEYTKEHFADEEEYMESVGYEGLPAQLLAHESFVDRLEEIDIEDMDDNQQQYLEEIVDFLLAWLKNHILSMDKLIPVK